MYINYQGKDLYIELVNDKITRIESALAHDTGNEFSTSYHGIRNRINDYSLDELNEIYSIIDEVNFRNLQNKYQANLLLEENDEKWQMLEESCPLIKNNPLLYSLDKKYSHLFYEIQFTENELVTSDGTADYKSVPYSGLNKFDKFIYKYNLMLGDITDMAFGQDGMCTNSEALIPAFIPVFVVSFILRPFTTPYLKHKKFSLEKCKQRQYKRIDKLKKKQTNIELKMDKMHVHPTTKLENDIEENITKVKTLVPGVKDYKSLEFRNKRIS